MVLLPLWLNLEAVSPPAQAEVARRRWRMLMRRLGYSYWYGYRR